MLLCSDAGTRKRRASDLKKVSDGSIA